MVTTPFIPFPDRFVVLFLRIIWLKLKLLCCYYIHFMYCYSSRTVTDDGCCVISYDTSLKTRIGWLLSVYKYDRLQYLMSTS